MVLDPVATQQLCNPGHLGKLLQGVLKLAKHHAGIGTKQARTQETALTPSHPSYSLTDDTTGFAREEEGRWQAQTLINIQAMRKDT